MQLTLFDYNNLPNLNEEMFQAYFDCRKNKRNTINALQFEMHLEQNLFDLIEEIKSGTYLPGKSLAFVVNKPVKREIFAADFKDRVVHHFLINKLNPLFEGLFISDSYACRENKGTHFGINRVKGFIEEGSLNFSQECFILKLDILGFFMHIDKRLLFQRLKEFIDSSYFEKDKELVIELCSKIIFNDPTDNCLIKGKRADWAGLPNNKSLFHSPVYCGLPIGNLTSQVFANFYLDLFDKFIMQDLGIKYYGRYVDDFVIVHPNKEYLKLLIPRISAFLSSKLHLTLHPKKVYLQSVNKGVKFLGVILKPSRIYVSNRTKGNFYLAIKAQNKVIQAAVLDKSELSNFLSSLNSYLGIFGHYNTFRIRKNLIFKNLDKNWFKKVYLDKACKKFTRILARKNLRK